MTTTRSRAKLDPATLSILASSLTAVAREMGVSLFRAAFSGIVRESEDATTCLLNRHGEVIAQEFHLPMHMASMGPTMRYMRDAGLLDDLRPGQILITNDPYMGRAHHLPDMCIFWPVFVDDGQLLGYAGCIAHQVDIGGTAAGTFAGATEIYQEGLRIPAMVVDRETGLEPDGVLRKMVAVNVRMPDQVLGDLDAQLAALRVGESGLLGLAAQYGTSVIEQAMEELVEYSETVVRARIQAIPDGSYLAEDFIDDDGEFSADPIKIGACITVDGSELTVDLSETDKQAAGPINCPRGATEAGVALSLIPLIFGSAQFDFVNDGCLRPIKIVNPEGTLLNPRHPAAVDQRALAMYRLYTTIHRAMAQALPGGVAACGIESANVVSLSKGGEGAAVHFEGLYGGLGAGPDNDGADAVAMSVSNAKNQPIEAIEMMTPFVRMTKYALRPGSGGAGRHRGGLGIIREYEILEDGVELSVYADRHRFRPWGLEGGEPAANSQHILIRDGVEERVPSKFTRPVRAGDRFRLETGGGGGYGPPAERPQDAIDADVLGGYISPETAVRSYGSHTTTES